MSGNFSRSDLVVVIVFIVVLGFAGLLYVLEPEFSWSWFSVCLASTSLCTKVVLYSTVWRRKPKEKDSFTGEAVCISLGLANILKSSTLSGFFYVMGILSVLSMLRAMLKVARIGEH